MQLFNFGVALCLLCLTTGPATSALTRLPPPLPAEKEWPLLAFNSGILNSQDALETSVMGVGKYRKVYVGTLKAGQPYVFELRSEQFQPALRIENSKGTVLVRDDGKGNVNAKVTFTPTVTEAYRIIVTSRQPWVTGGFMLKYHVEPPPGQIVILGALGMGKTDASGHTVVTHTQFLEAGKSYTINVNAPFAAILALRNPEGKILADTASKANATLTVPITVSGNYQLLVTSEKAGVVGGTYVVTIDS